MWAGARAQERGAASPRFEAIDFAVDDLGIQSFADLDMGPLGKHAFYAMDKPTVRHGVLADARRTRPRDQLVSAIEHAAERPGMRIVDGDVFDPATVAEIGDVDGIFMFNLLLHTVAPDWDRVLELYAPNTSCLVIANPQWQEGERAVRLTDLGRDRFLEAVPASERHRLLFDRLDDWHSGEGRPHRDAMSVWQWGITDVALTRTLEALGFLLVYDRQHGPFPGAAGFVSKTFVFRR
jgi:hypothetical protein